MCLLACQVFGGHPEKCDDNSDKNSVVSDAVGESLKQSDQECAGITCVVDCAKALGCLDKTVKGRCMNVKQDKDGSDGGDKCNVNCDGSGAYRTSSVGSLLVITAAAAAAIA